MNRPVAQPSGPIWPEVSPPHGSFMAQGGRLAIECGAILTRCLGHDTPTPGPGCVPLITSYHQYLHQPRPLPQRQAQS